MVRVESLDELTEALAFAEQKQLEVFVLGGGSNLLVHDEGYPGVVIKIEFDGIERDGETLVADAGESWDTLVEQAVAQELWGLENLSGIPGSVGGAIVGGIGAYGAAVGETLMWAEAFDRQTRSIKRFTNAECKFGYRDSVFKRDQNLIVLRAAFGLHKNGAPNTTYRDLAGAEHLSIKEVRARILDIRKQKFPDLAKEGTAGSFFKNPILPRADAEALHAQYPDMPLFAMPEVAGVKVPLAWLLDQVLGIKGMQMGGARLFEKQPLVIAAARDARAVDVIALKEKVKTLVKEKLFFEIEEEVRIL